MPEWIRWRKFNETEGAEDWQVLGEGACAFYRTGSFADGVRLVQAIGELTDLDAHHPDVDVRHDGVTVRLVTITENEYGLTDRDIELAKRISTLARDLGLVADPSNVQRFRSRSMRWSGPTSCRSGGPCSAIATATTAARI